MMMIYQNKYIFHSSATKASFISSLVFLLSHIEILHFQRELVYLCIISMFVYVRIITLFFKQYDPLMPFENLSSGLLFSNWVETVVRIKIKLRFDFLSLV